MFLFVSCSTITNIQRPTVVTQTKQKGVSIKWNTTYEAPTTESGELIIKNPKTGKEFKMSYADFFIMKKAYTNWRTVESTDPVITNVEQNGEEVIVSFNYMDEKSKSILSGQFIVDLQYIVDGANSKKVVLWQAVSAGFGSYGIIATIVLLIIFL